MPYKGKKLIIHERPWWRHPIFPWGWYSLKQDKVIGDEVRADGFAMPSDGGGGLYQWVTKKSEEINCRSLHLTRLYSNTSNSGFSG